MEYLQTINNFVSVYWQKLPQIHIEMQKNLLIFLILVLLIFILPTLTDFFLSRSFLGIRYRLFVAPGVVVHELSHAVMCLLTLAPITKITLFDKEGGSVEHKPSKIPLVGQLLISIAPFFFGLAAIYMISSYLKLTSVEVGTISYENIIHLFKSFFVSFNATSYINLILVYLIISILVALTPSKQDIKNCIFSLIIILSGFFAWDYFSDFRLLKSLNVGQHSLSILIFLVCLLILFLFLSMFLYVITKFFRKK